MNNDYNYNYDNEEMEIDILDLMFHVLSKWRVLLIACLVCAVLVGVGKYALLEHARVNDVDESVSKAKALVRSKEHAFKITQSMLKDAQKQLKSIEGYIADSPLMHVGTADTPTAERVYQVVLNGDPAVSRAYFRDPSDEIAAAYVDSIDTNYVAKQLRSKYKISSNIVSELYNLKYDQNANTVTVEAYGKTKAMAKDVLNAVCSSIENKTAELNTRYHGHTITVVSEQVTEQFNKDFADRQLARYNQASSYSTQIDKLIKDVESAEEEIAKAESKVPSPLRSMKSGIKFALIAFFACGVVMCGVYFMRYILKNQLHTASELSTYFRLPVLAELNTKRRKNECFIDKWFFKIFGKESVMTDDAILEKLAAFIASAVSPTDKLALVSSGACPAMCAIADKLSQYAKGYTFAQIADLATSAKSTEQFNACDIAICIEERNISRINEAGVAVELAQHLNKRILGFVVL